MNLSKIENKADFLRRVSAGKFIVRKRGVSVLGFYKVRSVTERHIITDTRTFTYQELFNFAKVFLLTGEIAPKEETAPQFKKDAKFILWAPKSNQPPRVVLEDGIDAALHVANDMARRHGGKFYVAHLVAEAEKKVTRRVIEDVTQTSRML